MFFRVFLGLPDFWAFFGKTVAKHLYNTLRFCDKQHCWMFDVCLIFDNTVELSGVAEKPTNPVILADPGDRVPYRKER